ncbi:hypothetical protein L7F22_068914, partial [Adiantum nelumboides]|nr:hypothetical protein [Adiantum nelumboides]
VNQEPFDTLVLTLQNIDKMLDEAVVAILEYNSNISLNVKIQNLHQELEYFSIVEESEKENAWQEEELVEEMEIEDNLCVVDVDNLDTLLKIVFNGGKKKNQQEKCLQGGSLMEIVFKVEVLYSPNVYVSTICQGMG